jgi:hypothetical protein
MGRRVFRTGDAIKTLDGMYLWDQTGYQEVSTKPGLCILVCKAKMVWGQYAKKTDKLLLLDSASNRLGWIDVRYCRLAW